MKLILKCKIVALGFQLVVYHRLAFLLSYALACFAPLDQVVRLQLLLLHALHLFHVLFLHFLLIGNWDLFLLLTNRIKSWLSLELVYKSIRIFLLGGAQVPDHAVEVIFKSSISDIQCFIFFQAVF